MNVMEIAQKLTTESRMLELVVVTSMSNGLPQAKLSTHIDTSIRELEVRNETWGAAVQVPSDSTEPKGTITEFDDAAPTTKKSPLMAAWDSRICNGARAR